MIKTNSYFLPVTYIALLVLVLWLSGIGCASRGRLSGEVKQRVANPQQIIDNAAPDSTLSPYRLTGLNGVYGVQDSLWHFGSGTTVMLFNMNDEGGVAPERAVDHNSGDYRRVLRASASAAVPRPLLNAPNRGLVGGRASDSVGFGEATKTRGTVNGGAAAWQRRALTRSGLLPTGVEQDPLPSKWVDQTAATKGSPGGESGPRPPYLFLLAEWYVPHGNPEEPWQDRWHQPVGREWDEWVWRTSRWRFIAPYTNGRPTRLRMKVEALIFHVPHEVTSVRIRNTRCVVE